MTLRGPILVGTDFSAASDEALRQALSLATGLGTTVSVAHVVPELDSVNILFPQFADRNAAHRQALIDKALAALDQQITTTLGDTAPNIRPVVDAGTPHAGLLALAEATGAGLIVMGPGHTAERVVRHATVPALIARPSPRGIVVGTTDFSDPSLPALEAAASEARRRGSRLRLLHVVDVGPLRPRGNGGRRAALPAYRTEHVATGDRRVGERGGRAAPRGVCTLRDGGRGDREVRTIGTDDHRPRRTWRRATRSRDAWSNWPFALDARKHGRNDHSLGAMLGPRGQAKCVISV
jgi:nucleotide-binding universal stress UspA family protein